MKNKFDSVIEKLSDENSLKDIQKHIKREFKLKRIPKRIEAYDVAHISGQNIISAKVVWEQGKFLNNENEVWQFDEIGEPKAITEAIRERFTRIDAQNLPDVILIDGGKTQIKAALEGLKKYKDRNFKVISAVKPKGEHNKISHFLDENLDKIEVADADTFYFLTNLRDHAHNLANQTHVNIRDTNHFYELAELLPGFSEKERRSILTKAGSLKSLKSFDLKKLEKLYGVENAGKINIEINKTPHQEGFIVKRLVPIRFDAEDGNAEDLQPIETYKF